MILGLITIDTIVQDQSKNDYDYLQFVKLIKGFLNFFAEVQNMYHLSFMSLSVSSSLPNSSLPYSVQWPVQSLFQWPVSWPTPQHLNPL